ncbi:hypothetical protein AgCh_017206 [Apium graveolens]
MIQSIMVKKEIEAQIPDLIKEFLDLSLMANDDDSEITSGSIQESRDVASKFTNLESIESFCEDAWKREKNVNHLSTRCKTISMHVMSVPPIPMSAMPNMPSVFSQYNNNMPINSNPHYSVFNMPLSMEGINSMFASSSSKMHSRALSYDYNTNTFAQRSTLRVKVDLNLTNRTIDGHKRKKVVNMIGPKRI